MLYAKLGFKIATFYIGKQVWMLKMSKEHMSSANHTWNNITNICNFFIYQAHKRSDLGEIRLSSTSIIANLAQIQPACQAPETASNWLPFC